MNPVLRGVGVTHRFGVATVLAGVDIAVVAGGAVLVAAAASRPLLRAVTTEAARGN